MWTGAAVLSFNSHALTIGGPDGSMRPGATAVWDPGADRWIRLPDAPLTPIDEASMVWTGSHLLVWGELYDPGELRDAFSAPAHDGGLSFGG